MPSSPRRGFTILELLVVVAVIAILAGMVMVAAGMLQRTKNKVATTNMMGQIRTALDAYMERSPVFGDKSPDDFRKFPWQYLYTRPQSTSLGALMELPLGRLMEMDTGGNLIKATNIKTATHMLDYYGTNQDNIISFKILEGVKSGRRYIKAIEMRSSAGTPGKKDDDIIYRYVAALDVKTESYNPGDAGKYIVVNHIMSDWTDPLDVTQKDIDDPQLQTELNKP